MKILITGAAGFIGSFLLESLGKQGVDAVGVDNFNPYYSATYKMQRLEKAGFNAAEINSAGMGLSGLYPSLKFYTLDICDGKRLDELFATEEFTHVVHLAAQPGVRRSLTHPYDYLTNNIEGFLTLLETLRHHKVEHLVYASSSSVYGTNSKVPFAETDAVNNPESLYAVTKRTDELMAQVYNHLYGIPSTGLRFFTVYGPWGRPDMAPILFGNAILRGEKIKVFNHGDMKRDFTCVHDIVVGIEKVLAGGYKSDGAHVYNIGHGSPVDLMEFIRILEQHIGKEAKKEFLEMQPGDVPVTYADTTLFQRDYGYEATTDLNSGLAEFAQWLKTERHDD